MSGGHAAAAADQPGRTQIEADWALYNGELALHTAVVAYFHLLPHPEIMIEAFSRDIPGLEGSFTRQGYSFLRSLFTFLLKLRPERAADSLTRIRMIFDRTDKRIADGRRFLVGDSLTLGDIALAAAAAPMVLPDAYAALLPPLAEMPTELRAIVGEMRQHLTANFTHGIYSLRAASQIVAVQ